MRRSAIVFILIALAQLAVPAWMIVQHERVLQEGEVFKFRTAPIDPRDPFRGEYVVLNFEASTGSWKDPHPVPDSTTGQVSWVDQEAYAALGASDTSGYAVITGLFAKRPSTGSYINVEYWGPLMNTGAAGEVVTQVQLPFDRFYLEEGQGAKTEKMLQPQWHEGTLVQRPMPAYALVRVYEGEAVIEDLIIGDRSIQDWLKAP